MESVNGKVKTSGENTTKRSDSIHLRLFKNSTWTLQQIPTRINSGTFVDNIAMASEMILLSKETNELQQFVHDNGMLINIKTRGPWATSLT